MKKYGAAQVAAWLVFGRILFFKFADGSPGGDSRFQSNALLPACQLHLSPGNGNNVAMAQVLVLIQQTFPQAYYNSSISHHFFVRMATPALQEQEARFVWTDNILCRIWQQYPSSTRVIPDVYHKIYLMQPEFDFVDDQNAHYDGILSLPGVRALRLLTYLVSQESPATSAVLVASSSQQNFSTDAGSTIALDFNRESHYASMLKRTMIHKTC